MNKFPVFFVGGMASDVRLWQPVIDRLSDIVEPHLTPCNGSSIADFADEILASAPERFAVAGISMGGYVALDVALRGDRRLAGLALLNTNARPASEHQLQRSAGLLEEAERGGFESVAHKLGQTVAGSKPELAPLATAMAVALGRDTYLRQQRAVLSRGDRRSELHRIAIPTILIAGDEDRISPPSFVNEAARAIPQAQLDIFPGGHLSTLEVPDLVAASLRTWLTRIVQGGG